MILLLPTSALADSLVATRVIRAQETIAADAVTLVAAEIPGALSSAEMAIGQEAQVAIYPGRAVLAEHIGPRAVIDRNQIVPLAYQVGGLSIRTEGRALARGAVGEVIEAMNMASKTKVTGRVGQDGTIQVGPQIAP